MSNEENLAIKNAKIVAIIGPPCVGKSSLAAKLLRQLKKRTIIATDDYAHYQWTDAVYAIIADITKTKKPIILEGVRAIDVLLKGVTPDVLINMEVDTTTLRSRYAQRKCTGGDYPWSMFDQGIKKRQEFIDANPGVQVINVWSE